MKAKSIFPIAIFLIIIATSCHDMGGMDHGSGGMHGMNMTNDTAMMRNMIKDPAIMNSMMAMMMERCENDTAMCRTMYSNMMKSPKMKTMMMDMMKENGMMDMKTGDHMEDVKKDKQ